MPEERVEPNVSNEGYFYLAQQIDRLDASMSQQINRLEDRLDGRIDKLGEKLDMSNRWMIGLLLGTWTTLMLAILLR